jgi:hypothetical protein
MAEKGAYFDTLKGEAVCAWTASTSKKPSYSEQPNYERSKRVAITSTFNRTD